MENMENYELPEEIMEKIKQSYSSFNKLSEEQVEVIVDGLLSYIKRAGPGLIRTLSDTSESIKKNPTKALEELESEITKKTMELLIYFKILNDSTGNIESVKIYLKIITNLIPFFMEKLELLSQKDMPLIPFIFALSDGGDFGEGGSTPEREKRNSVDATDFEKGVESLMNSLKT